MFKTKEGRDAPGFARGTRSDRGVPVLGRTFESPRGGLSAPACLIIQNLQAGRFQTYRTLRTLWTFIDARLAYSVIKVQPFNDLRGRWVDVSHKSCRIRFELVTVSRLVCGEVTCPWAQVAWLLSSRHNQVPIDPGPMGRMVCGDVIGTLCAVCVVKDMKCARD